jgi:hypothetical protein
MLNEVRARHIKRLVVEQIVPGHMIEVIVEFEIAKREDIVRSLERQRDGEMDEITYLKSLDAKELHKASEALRNV